MLHTYFFFFILILDDLDLVFHVYKYLNLNSKLIINTFDMYQKTKTLFLSRTFVKFKHAIFRIINFDHIVPVFDAIVIIVDIFDAEDATGTPIISLTSSC